MCEHKKFVTKYQKHTGDYALKCTDCDTIFMCNHDEYVLYSAPGIPFPNLYCKKCHIIKP